MRTIRAVAFVAVLSANLVVPRLPAQSKSEDTKVLTNKDVVSMLSDSLPAEIVAAKVRASKCSFDTSVSALKELREAKVPDSVILAMVESPKEAVAVSDGKTRVFVTDSQSCEMTSASWYHGSGSSQNGNGSFSQNGGSHSSGGARPQTAEIIKTFTERCPQVLVTNQLASANYAVTLDHEGGKGLARHDNKVAVFKKTGDLVYSGSTRELGNAVKDACGAITRVSNSRAAAALSSSHLTRRSTEVRRTLLICWRA